MNGNMLRCEIGEMLELVCDHMGNGARGELTNKLAAMFEKRSVLLRILSILPKRLVEVDGYSIELMSLYACMEALAPNLADDPMVIEKIQKKVRHHLRGMSRSTELPLSSLYAVCHDKAKNEVFQKIDAYAMIRYAATEILGEDDMIKTINNMLSMNNSANNMMIP